MWFKNLKIYRLHPNFRPTAAALSEALERYEFRPCGTQEAQSIGWVSPRPDCDLAYKQGNSLLIALRTEKKVLPSKVVAQETKRRALQIEEQQGYKPGRKQMKEIKELVTDELLPKAFTSFYDTRVWLDILNRWFVIDTASPGVADEVLASIAKCITDFPVEPLYVNQAPARAMTQWILDDEAPDSFTIDQDAELTATNESRAVVKYVRQSVSVEEARNHIGAGKQVTRLALTWNDRVSFVLTDDLDVRRVAPLDILKENQDSNAQNEQEQFDADFALMTGELSRMLDGLVDALSGERDDLV